MGAPHHLFDITIPKVSKWARSPKYPLTDRLFQVLYKQQAGRRLPRSHIVSEKLCDDVLQRLSPYLLRNRPTDIVDLLPGDGLLSSKVNDFLKPRQHLLFEYQLPLYGDMLNELAAKNPCYKVIEIQNNWVNEDRWDAIFAEHLPMPPPNTADGVINDSLLVLANLTYYVPKGSHFTPSREWAHFMSKALKRLQFHRYGMTRILALMPSEEGHLVIPRTVFDRKRPALVTEATSKVAFNVANSTDAGAWTRLRTWDLVTKSATRVAERTAEQNVKGITGRENPRILMAPESADPGKKPTPYVPRVRHEWQQKYVELSELIKQREAELKASGAVPGKDKKMTALRQHYKRLEVQLNQDNRRWFGRIQLTEKQGEIDELEKELARAAANSQTDRQTLTELDSKLASMREDWAKLREELDYVVHDRADLYIDEMRAALRTGSLDNAVLLWDRRPFEPLHIKYDEIYPIGTPCSMIYFEPSRDSPLVKTLESMERGQEKHDLMDLAEEILSVVGMRNTLSVNEFLNALFPERPINDIVKAVPGLAALASKRLKKDFDSSVEASSPVSNPGQPTDPVYTYQENVDYDLSDVRIRSVPILVLWDLILEYSKWPAKATSTRRINTVLGGSMTDYQAAVFSFDFKAGKAAGKVNVL
ncbi:hypothetical protein NFIA_068400 [Paecilomyces variotii No. 5]|uniref:rRNA adenine N(6)-methyltransferase n=1 Tax=Byssochlamys spectabilis (strain No. 5 / NBRC 109023) TaxID=1356009 RepID=V5G8G6_BYSSN|nr:hypothetical protein NFIA_068400 [Paecilomyces variotii No. 5]